MSNQLIEITCPRCSHTWYEDLVHLDLGEVDVYRGRAQRREYRVRCSRCGTRVVVTVEVEEEQDDQATRG